MTDIPEFHGNPNDLDWNPEYVFNLKEQVIAAKRIIEINDLLADENEKQDKAILELATALKEAAKKIDWHTHYESGEEYRALAEKHLC